MLWQNFILEVLQILSWPSVVVLGAIILRKPLKDLVPMLRRLKYKDLELEFEKQTIEIRAKAERDIPLVKEDEPIKLIEPQPKVESRPEILESRGSLSSFGNVFLSWNNVEKAAFDAAQRHQIAIDTHLTAYDVAKALAQHKLINQDQLSLFAELNLLRNKASHLTEIVTQNSAEQYSDSASRMAMYLGSV